MDQPFWPVWGAIRAGELDQFHAELDKAPDLATLRSSTGHPTLMQALVLDGVELPAATSLAMARCLRAHGSPIDEPLISAGSLGNTVIAEYLVSEGAQIDGVPEIMRGWSIVEEALYWGNTATALRMLALGAHCKNLRIAAGIGDLEAARRFFDADGRLLPAAGDTNFPFCTQDPEQVTSNPQDVIDNALVYAAAENQHVAVDFLLARGAAVDAIPPGFHFRGSPLHYAAMRGRREMCERLLAAGASKTLRDGSDDGHLPAGWARHGGHPDLETFLSA